MESFKLWTSPYNTIYKVTRDGKVYRLTGSGWKETGKGTTAGGYHNFGGSKKEKRWARYVHRVVAKSFIPNPKKKAEVDHINGDKDDNCVENLRWATHEENSQNKSGRGCRKRGRRWAAQISPKGHKTIYLGMFDTEAEGHACYIGAKRLLHEFWSGR
jgi:hypothetical protein